MLNFLFQYNTNTKTLKKLVYNKEAHKYSCDNYEITFWGDPINFDSINGNKVISAKDIINNIIGNYYYLVIYKNASQVIFGNSVFSVLPLYYSNEINETIYISNDVMLIANELKNKTINKRFILENILFNYQLFNQTTYKEINLLPCNHCLELNNKLKLTCLLKIEDLFSRKPIKWRKATERISNLFLERVKHYFPNEKFVISLTGGFDGRTLVSSAMFHKANFDVYSFGTKNNEDVNIPEIISAKLKINSIHVSLEEEYVKNHSFSNGVEFLVNSNGCASFSRAHYLHSAKQLSKKYNYLITGNFGSELFRAAHIAGVVISENLYKLFNSKSYEEGILDIENSKEWEGLNQESFNSEWQELKQDLKSLPCFNDNYKLFSKNEQFYILVFNEVFRKYFGSELVNQYKYINNRTPFLDIKFITELLKTELSGIYSDYFTHNPFKRFKGQVTYAHIIKKSFPILGKIKTDKGYAPNDLISFIGKSRISLNFFKKKILRKRRFKSDGYAVNSSFKENMDKYKSIIDNSERYFNVNYLKNGFLGKYQNRDGFFIALSQCIWISNILKNESKKI